jgi:hypothetical protein
MRPLFAFLLFPEFALAQWLSAGVTGGVPISPQSSQLGTGHSANGVPGPNDLILKPYILGGTVQIKLLWKLSAVADFQYERIHQDFTYSNVGAGQTDVGTRGGASANVWLFPLLLRYDLHRRRVSPFVDLGAALRRLGPFNGQGYQLDFYYQPHPVSSHTVPGGNPEIAIAAGAGIRTRVPLFDLASEVRFIHWTTGYFVPVQNQAVLIVSVTFPAGHI